MAPDNSLKPTPHRGVAHLPTLRWRGSAAPATGRPKSGVEASEPPMSSNPPAIVAIDADDYHAEHVGKTVDGRQFFLTTPLEPAVNGSEVGLVLRHPDEEGAPWAVEVQPGNYTAFFEPSDSGEYDT